MFAREASAPMHLLHVRMFIHVRVVPVVLRTSVEVAFGVVVSVAVLPGLRPLAVRLRIIEEVRQVLPVIIRTMQTGDQVHHRIRVHRPLHRVLHHRAILHPEVAVAHVRAAVTAVADHRLHAVVAVVEVHHVAVAAVAEDNKKMV